MADALAAAPIPAKKIALVQVARRQLKLSEEEYRAILWGRAGVESTADLDERGFQRVMQHMTALGFHSTWTKRNFGNRPGMASPAQVELMRKLWTEFHGPDEKKAALNAWLGRFHHVSALRFVDRDKAKAVITALKAMSRLGTHAI